MLRFTKCVQSILLYFFKKAKIVFFYQKINK